MQYQDLGGMYKWLMKILLFIKRANNSMWKQFLYALRWLHINLNDVSNTTAVVN